MALSPARPSVRPSVRSLLSAAERAMLTVHYPAAEPGRAEPSRAPGNPVIHRDGDRSNSTGSDGRSPSSRHGLRSATLITAYSPYCRHCKQVAGMPGPSSRPALSCRVTFTVRLRLRWKGGKIHSTTGGNDSALQTGL